MFSEYASRFLAQSQSRISSFRQPSSDNTNDSPRGVPDRHGRLNRGSQYQPSRSYRQRPTLGNPYQTAASHLIQFPFASRASAAAAPAPLFYSATDEFREEDDAAEREREAADLYALQRSRRHFGASRLEESSETDGEGSRGSELGDGRGHDGQGYMRGRGIKSSWKGDKGERGRRRTQTRDAPGMTAYRDDDGSGAVAAMVDVGLESSVSASIKGSAEHLYVRDNVSTETLPDDPPAFQQFRKSPGDTPPRFAQGAFLPYQTSPEVVIERPRPPSSDTSSVVPPSISVPTTQPPRHDPFWSSLYFISLAALFASFFLVYLHTSAPSRKHPLGDTIYTTLRSSFHLLATDTLVAVVVSLVWLSLLRSFARPLIYIILIAVPIILTSFCIYPFVASFQGRYHGTGFQDKVMRWLSFFPALAAIIWTYTVLRGRHSLRKAIDMLEFSCRILAANPALLIVGFATLLSVVVWTWIWMGMFTRVFLGGHLSRPKNMFIIDFGTWWLAAYFVLIYLWTLAIGSGIQRATTAATVSQWYFHRLAVPGPTSQQVVMGALSHACVTGIGTVCFSTLIGLLVRLPLLILPRRITSILSLSLAYALIPSTITALTNPLTLTHAAIHSQPLTTSGQSVSQMVHLISPSSSSSSSSSLISYRLAKVLLHSTRLIMSLALGFGGWVSTARMLVIIDNDQKSRTKSVSGSMYAYIVGLIAATIGWAVLGAMEGLIGGVLDAVVVCWASTTSNTGTGEGQHRGRRNDRGRGGYCLEAEYLFGGHDVHGDAGLEEGR